MNKDTQSLKDKPENEIINEDDRSNNEITGNREHLEAGISLGNSYLEKGMVNEAREEFERVATVISDNIIVYKLLGNIYEEEGNEQAALNYYRIYLFFQPNDEEISKKIDFLSTEQPRQKKERHGESGAVESLDKPQDQIHIYTESIAKIYEKQGYLDKALETYEDILANDPDNISIQKKIESLIERVRQKNPVYDIGTLNTSHTETVLVTLKRWLYNLHKAKDRTSDSAVMGGANEESIGHPWS